MTSTVIIIGIITIPKYLSQERALMISALSGVTFGILLDVPGKRRPRTKVIPRKRPISTNDVLGVFHEREVDRNLLT